MKRALPMFHLFVLPSFALLALGGCAFTQATLNVGYAEAAATRGPLSTVESRRIKLGQFVDKRPEVDKIGYKKNNLGHKTAHIVTAKPVPEIVREALLAEFTKNGHVLDAGGASDIILSGEITTFWFDYQIGFWTIEFMGTIGIALNAMDAKSGAPLLTRAYQGHYAEKSMGGLEGTWQRVMNVALERTMREMSTDPRLVQALKRQ